MIRPNHGLRGRRAITRLAALWATAALGVTALTGCKLDTQKPETPQPKYAVHPPDATLPVYLRGTVKDLTIVGNLGNFPVSSYGLITGLRGTGDSTAPTIVRDWMTKEMARHGLGRESLGYAHVTP